MKDFNNPLFESLVFKANKYGMLDEQESSGKAPSGAVYQDFAVSLTTIGSKLVENYIKAVAGYPETAFKKKYMTELPSRIGEIAKAVNPQDNINAQITALLTAVTKELNDFLGQSKSDGVYGKHLVKWRNALRDAFSNYKLGIEDAKTYMAKYTGTFDPKVTAMLSNSLASIKTGVEKAAKEREEFTANRESLNASRYTKTGESETGSMGIIEKLVDKKIAIDFRSFSTIVNEEKLTKRQAKKEAKGLLADIDSTIGGINGVLTQLAARESDPRRKDFKSIQMKTAFAQIGGDINDIRTQITDDAGNLKPRRDLAELPLDQLGSDFDKAQTLFTDKQKEYEDLYSKEEGGMKSTKTLDVATPEVNKRISDGDQVFGTLSSLSLYAGQMAAEEMAKPPAAAAGTAGTAGTAGSAGAAGTIKLAAPLKRGAKGDQVKAVQELIMKKMKDKLANSEVYKKFSKYGADGIFGKSTAAIIPLLKSGFELTDKSSEVTQELVDKLSAVKESFIFEQEFNMDAYNKAESGGSSGPKKATKDDIKSAKKDLTSNAKEIMKAAPKLDADTVKKQIDDAVAKAKQEWSKDQAIKELKEIGAKENPDYGKNGQMAVATATGIRFYANGVALRQFDKMMGTYSIKNDEFKGNDGSKDKLSFLMKSGIPFKYALAFAKFNSDPSQATKDCINWSNGTISILNNAFKIAYGKSLDKHLANKLSTWYGSVDDNIDKFRKKFTSVLT